MKIKYDDIHEIIPHIPIFGALAKKEIDAVLSFFSLCEYKAGNIIIEENGSPNNIYLIRKGTISVEKQKVELIKLGVGDIFGEVELIGIIPYIASCIAVTNCTLYTLPKKSLYTIKKEQPELFIKLILNISRECCRRLAKADNFIMEVLESPTGQHGDYY
ncbi:MAG: cyclic nucleotide-binding domain-containing protein [Fusobacteriaceae bacterium]